MRSDFGNPGIGACEGEERLGVVWAAAASGATRIAAGALTSLAAAANDGDNVSHRLAAKSGKHELCFILLLSRSSRRLGSMRRSPSISNLRPNYLDAPQRQPAVPSVENVYIRRTLCSP